MAIQFPPVNIGDPEPQNGDTYLYLPTQSEFMCFRRSQLETAQWSEQGLISTTSFGYRGGLNITGPAPNDANKGNVYSVLDGGEADFSFTGLAGTTINQYTLIIFDDPTWLPISLDSGDVISGPWIRTFDGQIKPSVSTDDLNMDEGSYRINELPEL